MAYLLLLCAAFAAPYAVARDAGQWEASDAQIREWYRGLMRPDEPMQSCCGEADAYWADAFESAESGYVAIITDDREVFGRPPLKSGTRVPVPTEKLKYDAGNPTGHGVIFIGVTGVLCFVAPGGV